MSETPSSPLMRRDDDDDNVFWPKTPRWWWIIVYEYPRMILKPFDMTGMVNCSVEEETETTTTEQKQEYEPMELLYWNTKVHSNKNFPLFLTRSSQDFSNNNLDWPNPKIPSNSLFVEIQKGFVWARGRWLSTRLEVKFCRLIGPHIFWKEEWWSNCI